DEAVFLLKGDRTDGAECSYAAPAPFKFRCVCPDGDAYQQMLIQNILENGSNPLIRRQALINIGNFDQSLTLAEDWDMWLRLASRYDFVTVPYAHVLYRTSSDSASTNVLQIEKACLSFIEKAFNSAPSSLQFLKRKSLTNLYHYLTFKSLEFPSEQKNAIIAIRFLQNIIRNDLSVIMDWETMSKALFKIIMVFLLSPQQYKNYKSRLKRFFFKESKQQRVESREIYIIQ
ncbi:MAG: hypothetical protein MJK14_04665, partial [Rivularia sp. ALOHA_DT_140]|nr:hypothetical protein [Rivularia sp. ALOHA_DT_140]